MAARKETPLAFADAFAALETRLPGKSVPWLSRLRAESWDRYAALGLPAVRDESWKFTNLNALRRAGVVPVQDGAPTLDAVPLGAALSIDAHLAVLVNGVFRADLSALPDEDAGLSVMSFAAVADDDPEQLEGSLGKLADGDTLPMAALNTALAADGLVIHLRKGTEIEKPLHILSIGIAGEAAVMFQPRVLVTAEENSSVCILESHVGAGDGVYFSNTVTELDIAPRARVRHYKLQNEHPAAFHIAAAAVSLADGAAYENFVLQVGGRIARNEIHVHIGGEHAECTMNGAYLLRGKQHADSTTFVDHAAPNSQSREFYKGVIDDTARGVFQGKILVRKDSQKTDGQQLNKALLLSRGAEIDSKPELEIYADDVICSHGATAGELDNEALFYLRSRGIDEATARGLLIEAFVGEAVQQIDHAASQEAFQKVVDGWLHDGAQTRANDGESA
jgi:Fe-S cluster assembly protein SufD